MSEDRFTGWRKSSYSEASGSCVEVTTGDWRKSSHSNDSGNCVEVSAVEKIVGVRDSKLHGEGPVLEFTAAAWGEFLGAARSDRLSR